MLIALFSALAALAVSGSHDAHAHGNASDHATVHLAAAHSEATVTHRGLALRSELRRLWEDHITWTRLAIISLTTDSP